MSAPGPVVVDSAEYVLARYADTLDRVRPVSAHPERLLDAQVDVESQFLHRLAFPCKDREAAYELEMGLLEERESYLSKKADR